jgi:single-stranded DNA-specific DHH superfamily exonuclease
VPEADAGPGSGLTIDISEAREQFAGFIARLHSQRRVVVFHDSDADGVTAGILLHHALQLLGLQDVVRVVTSRERDAWSEANRSLMAVHEPAALFVLDLGSRDRSILEGVPTCIIDHHRPDGFPPDSVLISAYRWDPVPNTSLLVYELCRTLVDMSDVEWIAAVGVLSDLGERAPFPIIASVRERYSMSHLKEVTTLVNAARRSSSYQPETAARALIEHRSPKELIESERPEVVALREAREEVRRELAEAKKAAPKFAGNVALVRVRSRCQVHPVIAQIWRTRLPKYIVIVSNDGYIDGRVNFSARTASSVNLLDFLRSFDLGEGEGSYARGHDQATGGSLPVDRWNLLLEKMGFGTSGA